MFEVEYVSETRNLLSRPKERHSALPRLLVGSTDSLKAAGWQPRRQARVSMNSSTRCCQCYRATEEQQESHGAYYDKSRIPNTQEPLVSAS